MARSRYSNYKNHSKVPKYFNNWMTLSIVSAYFYKQVSLLIWNNSIARTKKKQLKKEKKLNNQKPILAFVFNYLMKTTVTICKINFLGLTNCRILK